MDAENTNPLDFPRYVRSLRPSLPDSLPLFIDDELEKISASLRVLEEAVTNDAEARVQEERIVRANEDEALAARIISVEAEFEGALTAAVARIETEEIARATADEAITSRIDSLEADFQSADADLSARVSTEELARSTADEALASRIETVEATYRSDLGNTNARVSSEMYARATQDEALGVRIDTLTATVDANTAAIVTEQTVRATEDAALASSISSLTSTVNANTAAITTEQTTRADADTALSSSITALTASVNSNTAAITTEQTVRATNDYALANEISTLTTSVNGNTATITTQQSSINGLLAKYGVTLDVNGYITGFSQNNNGSSGEFVVKADTFKVVSPGETAITPFSVTASGVEINGNLMVSGSILNDAIGTGAVDTDELNAGAVSVPYTYDGSTATLCSVGVETTVLEMPSAVTVGDSTDGGAVAMFFGEIDSSTNKDLGLELKMYVAIDGGAYSLVGRNKGGMRTANGNTYFDLPVAVMHSITTAQTVRIKVTAQPYVVDTASDTRAGYIRYPKLAIMGAKR